MMKNIDEQTRRRLPALRRSLRGTARAVFLASCWILCLASRPASAQTIRAYLSEDSVRVGDRFTLTVVAEHPNSSTPLFPSAESGEQVFGDLEIINIRSQGTLSPEAAAQRIDSLIYEVTTFALDTAYVPSIPVYFAAGADTTFAAASPLEIPIISLVPEDTEDIRDLAPLAEFPFNPWPWILGALALAALAFAGYYYWKRRKLEEGQIVVEAPVRDIPPYEEAMTRLRTLEKSTNLQDIHQIKPYYVELTEALRVYLSRRLKIQAMETTSFELMRELNQLALKKSIPSEAVYLTKRVLHVSDLVKFADMHPAPEVGNQAILEARKILDHVEEASRPAPATELVEEPEVAGAIDQ